MLDPLLAPFPGHCHRLYHLHVHLPMDHLEADYPPPTIFANIIHLQHLLQERLCLRTIFKTFVVGGRRESQNTEF
jgi:hypothetical protein